MRRASFVALLTNICTLETHLSLRLVKSLVLHANAACAEGVLVVLFCHCCFFVPLLLPVGLFLKLVLFFKKALQLNEIDDQTCKPSWGVKRNGKTRNERAASKLHSQGSSNHQEAVKEGKVTQKQTRSSSRSSSPPSDSLGIAQKRELVSRILTCDQ